MILARGRVLEIRGCRARVVPDVVEACERCAAGQGCGGGLFARLAAPRRIEVRARLAVGGIDRGDQVILGLPETGLLTGAFAVYAVPLAGLLIGAACAALVFDVHADAGVLAAGAAGFLAGLAWLARFTRRVAGDPRFEPRIVGRVSPRVE